jgi:hypothetical protein
MKEKLSARFSMEDISIVRSSFSDICTNGIAPATKTRRPMAVLIV